MRLLSLRWAFLAVTSCTCAREGAGPAPNAGETPVSAAAEPTPNQVCATDHVLGSRTICARYPSIGWACVSELPRAVNADASIWKDYERPLWQGFPDRFEKVLAGDNQVCGYNPDGTLFCKGLDREGVTATGGPWGASQGKSTERMPPYAAVDLGSGYWIEPQGVTSRDMGPGNYIPRTEGLDQVAGVSNSTYCAWDAATMRCWGPKDWLFDGRSAYKIGLGDHSVRHWAPVDISGIPTPIVQGAIGSATSCARTGSGDVYCWGGHVWGLRGNGSRDECESGLCGYNLRAATQVPLHFVKDLAMWYYGPVALREDGSVWKWGRQIQTTSLAESRAGYDLVPVPWSELGTDNARVLGVGPSLFACVVKTSGSLICWGNLSRNTSTLVEPRCKWDDCPPTEVFPACVERR